MIKKLRFLSLFLSLLLAVTTYAQQTITLGYCNNELSDKAEALGNTGTGVQSFQAAIRIPASRLVSLKGNKITKIRFASSAGLTNVYVWMRPALDQPVFGNRPQKVETIEEGWNEVTLTNPYEITGEEIYVGFNGKCPAQTYIYMDGESHPNGSFFYTGSGWEDFYSYGYQPWCIQAVVEVDAGATVSDMALEGCTFASTYSKIGESVDAYINVANYGVEKSACPKVLYSVNGGEAKATDISGDIEPGKTQIYTVSVPTDANTFKSGTNEVKIWLDIEDAVAENNSVVAGLNCYENAFPRKVLLEHFTTLVCVNCPYGHNTLSKLLEGKDNYVWVSHHVGYNTDELTVNASNQMFNFGLQGAPSAMFDRSIVYMSDRETSPILSIGYPNAELGASYLTPDYDACAATPAFVSVNISNKYDAENQTLETTISGEKEALFDVFFTDSKLSVQLVEDKVNTIGSQSGSGQKVHNNVFRMSLTEFMGDDIQWDGSTYSMTFTTPIAPKWNPDNLRVVAFVNRGFQSDLSQVQVLNANQLKLTDENTGIEDLGIGDAQVLNREYYNLQGQKMAAPLKGMPYIERVTTTEGVKTLKRL